MNPNPDGQRSDSHLKEFDWNQDGIETNQRIAAFDCGILIKVSDASNEMYLSGAKRKFRGVFHLLRHKDLDNTTKPTSIVCLQCKEVTAVQWSDTRSDSFSFTFSVWFGDDQHGCFLKELELRQMVQGLERKEAAKSEKTRITTQSKDELSLLISGYIHCGQIPQEIIHWIACYHWSQFFDYFNAFRVKQNPDRSAAKKLIAWRKKIYPDCDEFKYLVVPLSEIKQSYLLPFDAINISNDGIKTGKYSSYRSKHCPSFIKQKNCAIHKVVLDKNDESVYHLLDSFVVNKFVESFDEVKANKHWHKDWLHLPAGRGPFRSGFRCVGSQKPDDLWFYKEVEDPDRPWEGRWNSWQEILIKENDLKSKVFPFLMKEIVFDVDIGRMDIDAECWDEQKAIFCELFLKIFEKNQKKNKIRAFWCRHIAFDFFDENSALADKALCCVDDEKLMIVWALIHRQYG